MMSFIDMPYFVRVEVIAVIPYGKTKAFSRTVTTELSLEKLDRW